MALLGTIVAPFGSTAAPAPVSIRFISGRLSDGSDYVIGVPSNWNHTLVMYSHGYEIKDPIDVRADVLDDPVVDAVMRHGYAVAAPAYVHQGWAVKPALSEQMELLDRAPKVIGAAPSRTIAMGDSMGGDITVALAQLHPDRFNGALSMCGVVSGPTPFNAQAAIAMLAGHLFLRLPYPHERRVVAFEPVSERMGVILSAAQKTPAGRAHLALIAALDEIPGWNPSTSASPPPDAAEVEANQYMSLKHSLPGLYVIAENLSYRSGGFATATAGLDPAAMLGRSPQRDTVRALYAAAGLSLDADLTKLQETARAYPANSGVQHYLRRYFDPNGMMRIPLLSIHTIGDDVVPVSVENRFRALVTRAGDSQLRQEYIARYGHCVFTPAEVVVTTEALAHRIETGRWGDLSAAVLNAHAGALGSLNRLDKGKKSIPTVAAFTTYDPPAMTAP